MKRTVEFAFVFLLSIPVAAQNLFEVIPGADGSQLAKSALGFSEPGAPVDRRIAVHESALFANEFVIQLDGVTHIALPEGETELRSGGDFRRVFRLADAVQPSFVTGHAGSYYGMVFLETGETLEIRPDAQGEILRQGGTPFRCEAVEAPPEIQLLGVYAEAQNTTGRRRAVAPWQRVIVPTVVLYTPAALQSMGGDEQKVYVMAQGGVDAKNLANKNSLVTSRWQLAGIRLFQYNETGDGNVDLKAFAQSTDANQARRDLKASTAGLLTKEHRAIAYMPLGGKFTPAAGFYLVSIEGPEFSQAFAHESTHTEGAQHDIANSTPVPNDPYGFEFGWQFCNGPTPWITTMSYGTSCNLPPGQNPAWLLQFSNPSVWIGGVPTGVEGKADNAKMIGIGAPRVAAYVP